MKTEGARNGRRGKPARDLESPHEWDFFPKGARRSAPETLAILDYERARESAELVERVKAMPLAERERQLVVDVPPTADHPRGRQIFAGHFHGRHERRGWDVTGPHVPLICFVVGDDFPAPWLSLPERRRQEVLDRVRPWYPPPPMNVFDYPKKSEDATDLAELATAGGDDLCLCVFALDRSLTKDAILMQFHEWLARREDVRGDTSPRGLRKPKTDLLALACWRLCKVAAARRRQIIPKHFNPATRQGIEGAAKRAEASLRREGLLPPGSKK